MMALEVDQLLHENILDICNITSIKFLFYNSEKI